MKKVIHIINVSAQPIPNVLPVLEDVQKYGTESVAVLICASAQMQERASWIEGFLRDKGVEVVRHPTRVPENDWNELSGYFDEVARSIVGSASAEKIIVNLTGGTKLMSFAIYSAFFSRSVNAEIAFIYVDTPSKSSPKCLNILSDDSHEFPEGLLRVEDFLTLYGKPVTNGAENLRPWISPADRAFLDDMLKLFLDGEIGYRMNFIMGLFCNGGAQLHEFIQSEPDVFAKILNVFKKHGRTCQKDGLPRPTDEKTFLTGIWLEHYVYDILKKRKDIQDVATGIKYATKQGVENEVDVAFVRHNRLFVVECKTGSKKDTDGIAYKYKDVVKELGIACTGWLISIKKLTGGDTTRLKEEEKIELCSGNYKCSDIPSWINNQLKKHSAP